ncbi:phenylcoumaran benzylic ether reductase 1 [Trichoderma asperellum]|uniref:Phenylcoumaran benzylic ether reductase 1 n=1 Tax=Trichoderma asperellum TaxID=101201 RepID=A0A6V8R046_TRIAP|nr:phenylcoumaran benzylic ether reductase 1 [Trichoderma asperellum]
MWWYLREYDDFDALVAIFRGQDAVVSTTGTFASKYQLTAINAAATAGVRRFLPSEYGGNTSLVGVTNYPPFAAEKKAIVDHLRTKESQGLTWTALCVGIFFSWVLEEGRGTLGWDIDKGEVTIYDSGNQEYDTSTVDQVARSTIAILRNLEETENTYVFVNSFTSTQNQTLSAMERIQGKAYKVSRDTSAAAIARGLEQLERGEVEAGYHDLVTGTIYDPGHFTLFKVDEVSKWKKILQLNDNEDLNGVITEVLRKKRLI